MSRRVTRTHTETRTKLLALLDDPNIDAITKAKCAQGIAAIEVATLRLRTIRVRESARDKRLKEKQKKEDDASKHEL
jgi:hypothetical protein